MERRHPRAMVMSHTGSGVHATPHPTDMSYAEQGQHLLSCTEPSMLRLLAGPGPPHPFVIWGLHTCTSRA